MPALLHAHSGLRFLVLLLGAINLLVLAVGLFQKRPFGRLHRALGASFTGALHLQVVLGLGLVGMGRWFPALAGHLAMMGLAAVVGQGAMVINRRRPSPGLLLPLLGVLFSLLCILGGVKAIGRDLLAVTITGG